MTSSVRVGKDGFPDWPPAAQLTPVQIANITRMRGRLTDLITVIADNGPSKQLRARGVVTKAGLKQKYETAVRAKSALTQEAVLFALELAARPVVVSEDEHEPLPRGEHNQSVQKVWEGMQLLMTTFQQAQTGRKILNVPGIPTPPRLPDPDFPVDA